MLVAPASQRAPRDAKFVAARAIAPTEQIERSIHSSRTFFTARRLTGADAASTVQRHMGRVTASGGQRAIGPLNSHDAHAGLCLCDKRSDVQHLMSRKTDAHAGLCL